MKILHVINSLHIGGAEVLLKDLIPLQKKLGYTSDIYLLDSTETFLKQSLKENGINILGNGTASIYSPRHILSLKKVVKDYDIVHVHLFPAQLWVAIAAIFNISKVSIVTTEHSTFNRRRKFYFWVLDFIMYSTLDKVICVSQATADSMHKWQPTLKNKIDVITNGVLIEKFRVKASVSKKELIPSLNEENIVIVSTGRFDASKDQNTLLRAVSLIKNVSLVLIGDGSMRSELELLSEKLNISNRVHFLGRREDVAEILAIGDIYVQSSNWEGFGIAAVEAMASGLPVIASNVPGLCDVVGTSGLLFDAGNAEMLSQLIKQLINDQELLNKIGQECSMRSEDFSLKVTASKYIDLYKQLV